MMAALRKRSEVATSGTRVPQTDDFNPADDAVETREQHAGEQAFAAAAGDEGQSVEVTIGDKLFQPIQYNGFRVGPFKAATIVRKGETVASAMMRLHADMMIAAARVHDVEAEKYVTDLVKLISKVNGAKLG
jgi:hypothetical protein